MCAGLFLKVPILSISPVYSGRVFHWVGAATRNALSPNVLVFVTGCGSLLVFFFSGCALCDEVSLVQLVGHSTIYLIPKNNYLIH